jgi:hypothetical protein
MTSPTPPDGDLAPAVKELTKAIHAFNNTILGQIQGLRVELVHLEEAIRDTASPGHGHTP